MIAYLLPLLALSSSAVSAAGPQRVLGHHDGPSNFIHSSIFGRKDLDINSVPDTVILTPLYRARDSNGNDQSESATFAHLPFTDCTKPENNGTFDIGIVGHPFDLGVSYRPGARFGPNGARLGARRLAPAAGWRSVT
jgi:agmatinase